ncbi:MAG TPA: hypothetical protein VGS22_08070 [Thermoanaerobaculia bacterium]|jgi:hypothetical protein|nr:hypothetical protein [Thermoanaerobaculia bacterium]
MSRRFAAARLVLPILGILFIGFTPSASALPTLPGLAAWWSHLQGVMASAWGPSSTVERETGCDIGPKGRSGVCMSRAELATGCDINPDGRPGSCLPRIELATGCDIDPNGRCVR